MLDSQLLKPPSPKDPGYKDYVLSDTFTFWKETDDWPIYEQPHREMFAYVDDSMPDMSLKRESALSSMMLAPRFTYKTYGICKAVARMTLKYPNISIGIFRSTREESRKMLSLVSNIVQSPRVEAIFGNVRKGSRKWDEDAVLFTSRTVPRTDPTIFTMGTGGTSTGNHPDLIIADDLVTEINCDSVKEQEKLWAYIDAYEPQMPAHGGVLLTGTRWSEIDAYGKVLALNAAARRSGVPEEKLPWRVYIKEAYVQKPDGSLDLYFPAYLTQQRLDSIKLKVDVRKYNAWFFNRMVDPAEKPFKAENIVRFCGPYKFDWPHRRSVTMIDPEYGGEKVRLYVALILDPSLTDETSSCGYGITVIGWDTKKNWYVLQSMERVMLPSSAREIIKDLLLEYHPNRVLIESAGGDAELITWIGGFLEREKMDCIVQSFSAKQHEVAGKRAKHQRIRSMEPFITNRQVFFRIADTLDVDETWGGYCSDLLRQIDAWPSLIRNDAIDSWAMGRYVLPWVPTEPEEELQAERDRRNPPEWDMTWTDREGVVHGVDSDKISRLAMGPPPGSDANKWLVSVESGMEGGAYRPGARTTEYLRRKRANR